MTRALLIALLLAHTAVTLVSLQGESPWSVFPPFREKFVYQIFSDLVCSLALVLWLCHRAGRPLGTLVLVGIATALFGSFAPLLYIILTEDKFARA